MPLRSVSLLSARVVKALQDEQGVGKLRDGQLAAEHAVGHSFLRRGLLSLDRHDLLRCGKALLFGLLRHRLDRFRRLGDDLRLRTDLLRCQGRSPQRRDQEQAYQTADDSFTHDHVSLKS